MRIPINEPFHFKGAVTEHGWWMLSPNVWDEEHQIFYRSLHLTSGRNLWVGVTYAENALEIHCGEQTLTETEKHEIQQEIAWIFRLEENFEEFYNMATEFGELNETVVQKRGRLLRSPSLFEDVTKVILTTNTSWQQTRTMAARLVDALGEPISSPQGPLRKTFPSPEKVLDAGEDFLKREVRVGYRSAYLIDVAKKAVDPSFDLEAFKKKDKNIQKLKTIKGVGPYAFSTIAMLLGRYDTLPVDSVYKAHVREKYFNEEMPSKKELESVYDKWGDYKHLAYWFDR